MISPAFATVDQPARVRDQRGFALIAVTLLLLLGLTLGAGSVLVSTLDLRATAHFDTGNRAFGAAEAGVLHALSTMNEVGVIDFQQDVVNRWGVMYGAARKTMPNMATLSYEIAIAADPGDPVNRGILTATGYAPLQGLRTIRVNIGKDNFGGTPGAIYLAADAVTSQFTGNAFNVDGNDHDMFGARVPGGPVKPGISTRNDAVTNNVVNSLNNTQKDNVEGLAFSLNPLKPSVLTTGGPSVGDLDQITSHLLGLPANVITTSQKSFNGNDVFGTRTAPQVTHMTNADVRLNGNASGAGILIVDGSLTINGTLDFIGWIIVRGDTIINSTGDADDDTIVLGNANVFGSLWTGHLKIKVGGSAIVNYCDACLRLIDNVGGNANLVPRTMRITSWQEL
ncbi:MAG: hypothetical protein AB7V27_14115 [Candidatus Binatia bacterium]